MLIDISADFLSKYNLNMVDVIFMWMKGWVQRDQLKDYLITGLNLEDELEHKLLDCLVFEYEYIEENLKNFYFLKTSNDHEINKNKILYCIFSWLFQQNFNLNEFFSITEHLYDAFSYIKELSIFIPYMPRDQLDLGLLTTVENMKKRIEKYLQVKEEEIKTGVSFNAIIEREKMEGTQR